ncbi:energy-coupling factor transport system permease protein [Ectothiorhodosinus mongolicus]|uniref:Energy-coupling factor transport system permease protein n=1 Tax=Ectothiorhodosinus mongolicus TaxID=233100 RepID=A0A1R3W564_9GAMM|nr:energy-coupling factor transporter transmembrane component T [Ectothiorhodosinus mongolicus]ULX57536.1 hypothetical protein CKX93_07575 [Ectothiorhodosinus mongolicus]SIT72688.1 energy-coupling factor transport system permease protein [Ectothiorhodosinus mongolicus]
MNVLSSQTLHPAVRILMVLAFILLMAHAAWPALLAGTVLAVLALIATDDESRRRYRGMLWRLKWFFLSLLVVFAFLTPGDPLWVGATDWLPSRQGLVQSVMRIWVLVLAVAAVIHLLHACSREALVSGLLWLTMPLKPLGFPAERFAVRLVLTLDVLPELQQLMTTKNGEDQPQALKGQRLQRWAERGAQIYQRALVMAADQPLRELEMPQPHAPGWRDWGMALLVFLPLLWLAL